MSHQRIERVGEEEVLVTTAHLFMITISWEGSTKKPIPSDWITKLHETGYLWHLLLPDHNEGIALRPHELYYKHLVLFLKNCGDYGYNLIIKERSFRIPLGTSNWKLDIFSTTSHVPKIGQLPLVDLSLSFLPWNTHNTCGGMAVTYITWHLPRLHVTAPYVWQTLTLYATKFGQVMDDIILEIATQNILPPPHTHTHDISHS